MLAEWIEGNPQRTCAVSYCVSADGLKHLHAVFEDKIAMRFSKIKSVFPKMHIEPTKGNKNDAESYISKQGRFAEDGEKVICIARHGEIKAQQGQRNDLEIIETLIEQGCTPNQIMDMSLSYRRFERIIRDAYYRKRYLETPLVRKVLVFWHIGDAGTGKSHTAVLLAEEHGEDRIYVVAEYKNGWDRFCGEQYLFMDEFRGQLPYAQLLNILSGYRVQIQARYTNAVSLWDYVHITSVYPPELVYSNMIPNNNKEVDSYEQLRRRIDFIVYHYKNGDEYLTHEVPMSEYVDYNSLRLLVHSSEFVKLPDNTPTPFEKGGAP